MGFKVMYLHIHMFYCFDLRFSSLYVLEFWCFDLRISSYRGFDSKFSMFIWFMVSIKYEHDFCSLEIVFDFLKFIIDVLKSSLSLDLFRTYMDLRFVYS